MNVYSHVSALVQKLEKRYNKDNLTGSRYLIIKRKCEDAGLGLFAYYITILAWIDFAVRHQMTPVIDMKNYANTYHRKGDVGKVNTWELFFEQPCNVSLEEALKSGQARYVWKDIPDYHPNDSLDFLYYKNVVSYYHSMAEKYIRFKGNVLQILQDKEQSILAPYKGDRILGVLARGTDYTGLKPYYNPVQPSLEQMTCKIDEYSEKYHCSKIYVATEDAEMLEQLIYIYGDKLLYTDQQRAQKVSTYLYKNKDFIDRDSFERGVEYLTSIYLLSKCNGLIAGRTSGTVGTCIMADKYEFCYVFALGRYGVEDKILCGE